MPAASTPPLQAELFSQDVIDRAKTRATIMKKLNDYQPQEGCKKPRITAPYNDLVWTLVSMLNEEFVALRNNNSRTYKQSIKKRQFDFLSYKMDVITQVSNRNGTKAMGLSTFNRYLSLLQDAGILLATNRKIYTESKGIETSPTTFYFVEKWIVLESLDEPKKAFFCSPYSPKSAPLKYYSNNKNLKNSDSANSLNEENKRLEKKGAVREKTDAGAPLETANLSDRQKICGKKGVKNDGTLPGQLWAQMYQTLYPNWSINETTQTESTRILAGMLRDVEEVLEQKFYQRVQNGVESYKNKQRAAYLQADDQGKEKIAKYINQNVEGVRRYFLDNSPCPQTEAFALLSRAILKAHKYQQKHNFTLNIYPTKYLANNFVQAMEWAHTEYDQIGCHRQTADMMQLAQARSLYYKLFKRVAIGVKVTKSKPELSQPDAIAAKYSKARAEFVAHLNSKCQQLTDETKQSLLQDFDAQITLLLSRPAATKVQNTAAPRTDTPNTVKQHTKNTAEQHTDTQNTASYDVRSEGTTFHSQEWQQSNEYDQCLREFDDLLDTIRRAPSSVPKPVDKFIQILSRHPKLDKLQKKELADYAQTTLTLILKR